jgi:hypothetical protein
MCKALAVLVVTPERVAEYEPALLNRFAKVQVEVADLLKASTGGGAAIAEQEEWLRKARESWPSLLEDPDKDVDSGLMSQRPTELVPGCPLELLEVVSLSAQLRAHSLGSNGVSAAEISKRLLAPLLPLEQSLALGENTSGTSLQRAGKAQVVDVDSSQQLPPSWEPQPTFASLLGIAHRTSASRPTKHTVMPLLVATFSDPEHWSDDVAGSLSGIQNVIQGVDMG